MPRRAIKDNLRQEINVWLADGIIDNETFNILQKRYESSRFGWTGIIKYLGITGGLFAAFGILGMLAALFGSGIFAVLMLAAVGIGITYWGIRLSDDFRGNYSISSKVILTLGTILWASAIAGFFSLIDVKMEQGLIMTGIICLPIQFFLAYMKRNQYLLIIALIFFFHWIGSWNAMWGRSAYVFYIQDPSVMAFVSLIVIAIGLYHEHNLYPKTGRFYLAWESLGLVYFNMSLLILSIWGGEDRSFLWILLFTLATIAQIIAGAALQNNLLRVFGIVFFAINLFTRYYEFFWEELSAGLYFFIGGALLMICGICIEYLTALSGKQKGESA